MTAFYEDLGGGRFRATEHTIGPWDARFQHGGPRERLAGQADGRHRRTTVSGGGVGLATSSLSDLSGPLGVGAQSLLVQAR